MSSGSTSPRRWTATWCRSAIGRSVAPITAVSPRIDANPRSEILGVGHRGREADEGHRWRAQDEDLFPHTPAIGVLEEVDLIEHHHREGRQVRRFGEQHVPEDLSGHDDDGRTGVDHGIARQEANRCRAVLSDELSVLLVRQCLEGCRVETGLAVSEGLVNGVGGDEGLSRTCWSGHEHVGAPIEGIHGLFLERIGWECQPREEVLSNGLCCRHFFRSLPIPMAKK